jgi:hypothetical protein
MCYTRREWRNQIAPELDSVWRASMPIASAWGAFTWNGTMCAPCGASAVRAQTPSIIFAVPALTHQARAPAKHGGWGMWRIRTCQEHIAHGGRAAGNGPGRT